LGSRPLLASLWMDVDWHDPVSRWNDLPDFAASYSPYPHQVEAFCRASEDNTIVILPTGTGKTLIAAMLIDLFSAADAFMFFVVNTVALVDQQTNYLRVVCRSPWSTVHPSHVGIHAGVTVGTAAALLGLAQSLPMERLTLVVFDEVHHATGDHPYVQVLRWLRETCSSPRILGLTATWLHGELRDLEAKRHSLETVVGATIFHPVVSMKSQATFNKVTYFEESPDLNFAKQMAMAITQQTQTLNFELACAFKREAQKAAHVETNLGVAGLSVLPHALCDIVGAQLQAKADNSLDECMREAVSQALQQMPRARSLLDADGPPTVVGAASAKAMKLLNLLTGRQGLTLVFVEQVCCVFPLAAMLARHLQELVLHVSGRATMSRDMREDHLHQFRHGTCRVLVATAALEEGLDVPDCDCVVRFDIFRTVKSHVQGSGRARKAGSEVFYFDNSPDEEERRTAAMQGLVPAISPEEGKGSLCEEGSSVVRPGCGEGHQWSAEITMWDNVENKSFRGQRCPCGSTLRITSRKYGQGRKKTERLYAVEGAFVCPAVL